MDAIIGTTAIDEIVAALEEILAGQKQNHYEDINAAPVQRPTVLSLQADILRI